MPESLSVIAELGIGLAGFSGVVAAIGYRAQTLRPLDRMRLIGLLLGSLGAALFATLPLLITDAGRSQEVAWGTSSLALVFGLGGFLAYAGLERRSLPQTERASLHPAMWVLTIGGMLTFIPVLLSNSIGLAEEPSAAPYLSALYFLLVYSSAQFFRVLLVRPGAPEDQE